MIVYDLTCAIGHRFESWFKSAAAFEAQQQERAVSCPFCGNSEIGKAPMAPRITRGAKAPAFVAGDGDAAGRQDASGRPEGSGGGGSASGDVPAAMLKMLRQVRQHIESNCDYVGNAFPEEARRIFYGESSPRGIYGEASAEEAAALREEGIEAQRIPWLPRRDS